MKELKYFFITDIQALTAFTTYWAKGDSFYKAFSNLKSFTSRSCECVLVVTDDLEAYVDDVGGGICSTKDSFTQTIAKFRLSQGRLSPLELKKV